MIKARAKCVKKREEDDESSEEDYDSYSAIDDGNILYHIYLRTMHIWILSSDIAARGSPKDILSVYTEK